MDVAIKWWMEFMSGYQSCGHISTLSFAEHVASPSLLLALQV